MKRILVHLFIQEIQRKEFLDGLVVKIPGFHCCDPGSFAGRGAEILQAARRNQKYKKQETKKIVKIICNSNI